MALKSNLLMAAAAAGATAVFAGGAVAQQAQTQPAPGQQQMQISPVTDAEIAQFALANTEVAEISSEANAELQEAGDQATAQQIQADAQEDMIQAIEAEGLSPERFTEIVIMARQDEDLANRLRAEMAG